jgi:hypothetical protein
MPIYKGKGVTSKGKCSTSREFALAMQAFPYYASIFTSNPRYNAIHGAICPHIAPTCNK